MRPTSFLRSLAGLSLTAGNKQQDSTIVGYPSRGARGIFTNPNNIAGSWGAAIRQQDGPGAGVCSFHQRLIRPPRGNRLPARTFWKKSLKYREGRKNGYAAGVPSQGVLQRQERSEPQPLSVEAARSYAWAYAQILRSRTPQVNTCLRDFAGAQYWFAGTLSEKQR